MSGRPRYSGFLLANEPRIPYQIGDAPEREGRVWEEIGERTAVMLARAPDEAIGSPELVDRQRRAATQETAGADEADERAGGEGAAAEAKDVDLVGGSEGRLVLVVLDQPVVGGADVGFESEAEAAAGERIQRSGTDAFEIELELCDAVAEDLAIPAFRGQREMMQDVGRVVAVVPGPVKTDREASDLGHSVYTARLTINLRSRRDTCSSSVIS